MPLKILTLQETLALSEPTEVVRLELFQSGKVRAISKS